MSQLKWMLLLISPTVIANELAITMEGESVEYYDQTSDHSLYQLTLGGEYSLTTSENSRIFINPRVRKSNLSGIKDEAQLIEGYSDIRFANADIRIGQQIISWGRTDIVNPINIGRQNFSDPLDDEQEKLGQLGINYRHYTNSGQLETIILPIYQDSTLPEYGSPWFVALPKTSDTNQNINYRFNDVETPDTTFKNTQWGIRYTSSINGWDFGASYFNGWNDVPIYSQEITSISTTDIEFTITPKPYRHEVLGIDFATTLNDISIRSEYAYFFTSDTQGIDPLVDDPYSHLVIGLDTDFPDLFDSLTSRFLIEYSRQYKTTNIEYTTQDLSHIFENTLFVRLSIEDQPIWSLEIDNGYDFENKGQLIRPKMIYNLIDDLKLTFSFEWLKGNEDSFFGSYEDNRSVRLTLSHERLIF